MTENMKTICVGRFLVDVPVQAEVTLSHEMIAGFDIETIEESEADFRARIAAREADLISSIPPRTGSGRGGLIEARDLSLPGMQGRTFVFGRSRGYLMEGDRRVDMESVSVESHAHVGGISMSLSAKHTEESSAREAEALLARLKIRGEDELPANSGFCVWRAVFAEPLPPHTTEHIAMHVALPDHPDLAIAFSSIPGGGQEQGLLARIADVDAKASADELLRVAKLRSGKRSINGLEGEEVLERVREMNFTTGYGFMWEMRGADEDPLRPYLLLQMETGTNPNAGGKPVDSSLHEDAVLVLWESISSSIRLRPSGPPPNSKQEPEPPVPMLGATAVAGDVCPQSGWWGCNEDHPGVDVQGGPVHYLRKGERMPQALLLPHPTIWQKLRGIQPSIEPTLPTKWKLIDKRQRRRTPAVVALAPVLSGQGIWEERDHAGINVTIGMRVRTGEACLANGWWRCEEAHALDGARWFPSGSALPAATFLVPGGLFGRVAGPEVIQRRSTWQLMRHAMAENVATLDDMPVISKESVSAGPDSSNT